MNMILYVVPSVANSLQYQVKRCKHLHCTMKTIEIMQPHMQGKTFMCMNLMASSDSYICTSHLVAASYCISSILSELLEAQVCLFAHTVCMIV